MSVPFPRDTSLFPCLFPCSFKLIITKVNDHVELLNITCKIYFLWHVLLDSQGLVWKQWIYSSGINPYSASLAYFFFPCWESERRKKLLPMPCLCVLIFPKQQVDMSKPWIMNGAAGMLQIHSGIDLFYSSLSSTHCGTGKTQNLPIFCAWEVSPGLYWLKLGKEKLESFHTFPVWEILLFKRIFQSEKQLSKAKLWGFFLLEMNSFAACQGIFFRFKGKRWQEKLSHQGQGKTKAGTVHDTGAEFLCDLEQDLWFVWILVFPIPGKELLIFPLRGCFQAFRIEIFQELIIWHRSPCSPGVWHWCHSKAMVGAEEKAGFCHVLNSSSALHTPTKAEWQWTTTFYLLHVCILSVCPFQQSSCKEFDSGREDLNGFHFHSVCCCYTQFNFSCCIPVFSHSLCVTAFLVGKGGRAGFYHLPSYLR